MKSGKLSSKAKERLLLIADHLAKNVDSERFNLKKWSSSGTATLHNCGSVGCAIGHAVSIPKFRKLGFKLSSDFSVPEYRGDFAWLAVKKFLDLNYSSAVYLFDPYKYRGRSTTPKSAVVRRIRKFVKEGRLRYR